MPTDVPERHPTEGGTGAGEGDETVAVAANVSLLKELAVGTVIDGKYRVDGVIGRGAMGVVVAATHIHLRESVALKFLNTPAQSTNGDFRARFRREAQVSAKLKNEHITRVIDIGVWRENIPFMVMDRLVGTDLRKLRRAQGRLPIGSALDFIIQVCEGIAEAHAHGIVHRDLKPSNLFIVARPDGSDLLKILDFGISKWSTDDSDIDELTQTGVVLGSPKYMSPEQLFGSSDVDPRADIWSIGAIFYELVTGRPPFDQATFSRVCAELASERPPARLVDQNPDVTPALEAVVMRCFARQRELRIQTVAELAGALLDAVEAPFAAAVRQKILAILEPHSTRDTLGTTSGGLSIGPGTFHSLSSTNASMSGSRSGALRSSVPPAAAATPEVRVAAGRHSPRRRGLVVVALASAVALAFGLGVAVRAKAPSGEEHPPSATMGQPTLAPQGPPASSATTGAAQGPANEPPSAPTGRTATDAADSVATPTTTVASSRAHGRTFLQLPRAPLPRKVAADSPPTPGAIAAPAAPPEVAPPAPLDPPKRKVNPLEDRQ